MVSSICVTLTIQFRHPNCSKYDDISIKIQLNIRHFLAGAIFPPNWDDDDDDDDDNNNNNNSINKDRYAVK